MAKKVARNDLAAAAEANDATPQSRSSHLRFILSVAVIAGIYSFFVQGEFNFSDWLSTALIIYGFSYARSCVCCCRKRSTEPIAEPLPVSINGLDEPVDRKLLRQRKELGTAYMLFFGAGWIGAHHFYLDRLVHGVLAAGTCNFFFLGWLLDGILLPLYMRSQNKGTSKLARSDSSCSRFALRYPLLSIFLVAFWFGVYVGIPHTIQHSGYIDIDKKLAKTQGNPYEILGLESNCRLADLDQAMKKQKARLQINCLSGMTFAKQKECKAKGKDLEKAAAFVERRLKKKKEDKEVQEVPRRSKKRKEDRFESDDADEFPAFNIAQERWSYLGTQMYEKLEKYFNSQSDPPSEAPDNSGNEHTDL